MNLCTLNKVQRFRVMGGQSGCNCWGTRRRKEEEEERGLSARVVASSFLLRVPQQLQPEDSAAQELQPALTSQTTQSHNS